MLGYVVPTVTPGNASVVIVSAGLTITVNDCCAVCVGLLLVTCAVKLKIPGVFGVPMSEPEADRDIPGGRIPEKTDHDGEGGPFAVSGSA